MKKSLLVALCATLGLGASAQTDIADARTYALNSTVTISGVVTNGSELGPIRYMQDGTAGLAAYGNALNSVNRGDSITVSGPLIEFAGLLEVSPAGAVVNHGPAVVQPNPLLISIPAAGESIESQLVQLDNVTFVQTGNFAGGSSTVQVTDGTNTLDIRVNASTNIAGTAIPTGAVSLVGLMGQFNANYQIVPRDLNDIIPYVAPSEEINVLVNGATVFDGGSYFVGNSASISVTIENTGSNALTITGSSFSGPDAGDFSSDIVAGSVGALSNNGYTISFTPATGGSKFATITIGNNDSDENPYIINFEGVGTDNLATEPTANPSGLTFPITEAYTVNGQYAAGSGAANYLVLWKEGSAITGVPADGTTYLRGDVVGDAKVAYMGPGTSFTPRGVIANQDYHFAVYAFNGSGGFENFLTTSPLTGNVASLGENIGSYYSAIDKNAATFNTDLYNLVNPHTQLSYFLYKQTMMSEFEIKDTTNNESYVTCALSGERLVFNGTFDWTATGYSREHTFPHSWMPSFPADMPEEPEYSDQHALYPANLDEANTPRSNLALDDIDGNVVFNYLGGSVGYKGTQLVYEPRESHKGNAARAIMYMVVTYNFDLAGNVNSDKQDQETLRNWHFGDLPDNYEIARQEYIFDLQGNRNPFIDSVDYACYVDFDANAHQPDGCIVNIEEKLEANFVVFPVPSNDVVYVQVNGTDITAYEVIDMNGRVVRTESKISSPVVQLSKDMIGTGTYMIRVETALGSTQRKLVIQ
ncbi:MAG: endonuclease [Crocinitomicaceae bacterium]|nr:endonuclease [Crocinitomicaceae bacterium]